MKKEILWRRNNKYKLEYDKYLSLKEWMPYKYQRFYELRQDYSFAEVLEMTHRKEKWYWNWREWFNKYTEQYINIIKWTFDMWNKLNEIADMFNITYWQVRHILLLHKKKR